MNDLFHPVDLGDDGESTIDLPLENESGKPKRKNGQSAPPFMPLLGGIVVGMVMMVIIFSAKSSPVPITPTRVVEITATPRGNETHFETDPMDVAKTIFDALSPIFILVTGVTFGGMIFAAVGKLVKAAGGG